MCGGEVSPNHLFLRYALQKMCHSTRDLTAAVAGGVGAAAALATTRKELVHTSLPAATARGAVSTILAVC
jgi:hypothetical protein